MPCQRQHGAALFPFVRLLGILCRFVQRSASVIPGSLGEPVFVQRSFALPGQIENLSQVHVCPDLCPLWVEVTGETRAKFIGGADVVPVRDSVAESVGGSGL